MVIVKAATSDIAPPFLVHYPRRALASPMVRTESVQENQMHLRYLMRMENPNMNAQSFHNMGEGREGCVFTHPGQEGELMQPLCMEFTIAVTYG